MFSDAYEPSSEGVWIGTFAAQIEELKIIDPALTNTDVVIEGGVGRGSSMSRVIRAVFPRALYIGMDLLAPGPSVEKTIPDISVWAMKQHYPRTILANCFDSDLLRDILAKTGTQRPLLFSVNALAALDSYWLPGDYQKHDEFVPVGEWFSEGTPYAAHIHLERNGDIWRSVREHHDVFGKHFKDVSESATVHGWKTHLLPSGFAVVRPSTSD